GPVENAADAEPTSKLVHGPAPRPPAIPPVASPTPRPMRVFPMVSPNPAPLATAMVTFNTAIVRPTTRPQATPAEPRQPTSDSPISQSVRGLPNVLANQWPTSLHDRYPVGSV